MKIDGRLTNLHYDFLQRCTIFEIYAFGNITESLEELNGLKVNLDLKKYNPKSHNINAYLWVLLGELQEKLKLPKEDIYRNYIRHCGVYEVIPIRDIALDKFIESWSQNGLGWVCDTTKSKLKGYTNVIAYYGTSVYNNQEMSVLVDQVVQDCIEQGIPTKPKEEIESLLEEWK